jgi:PIN domain nuclease of toxin-antitoxin system
MSSRSRARVYSSCCAAIPSGWSPAATCSTMSSKRSEHLHFLPDPKTWLVRGLAAPAIKQAAFTPDIAIDSALLLLPVYGDPADRLLIATARRLSMPISMRDRQIAAYAAAGLTGEVALVLRNL